MYKFDILETENFEIVKTGTKSIYNTDGKTNYLSEIKNRTKKNKNIIFPNMYGVYDIRQNGVTKFYENGLGYFVCEGDTVESNPSSVFLLSAPSYRNRGVIINESNFDFVVSYFSARLSISSNWKNQKDSYLFNENQINDDLISDCIVYSIFNNSSYQSSLRNVRYKNQNYKISNNFFWMSKKTLEELSENFGFDEMYNDVRLDNDCYVYKKLFGSDGKYNLLCNNSKNILEISNQLIVDSFEHRVLFSDNENQFFCWDASYAQLKKMWKEYFPQRFEILRKEYKELSKLMEKRTYELGFLPK